MAVSDSDRFRACNSQCGNSGNKSLRPLSGSRWSLYAARPDGMYPFCPMLPLNYS
jgi:hypothetical protein